MVLHLVLPALLLGGPSRPAPDSIVAFVDVSVIPMDRERVIPGQTVVVQGSRITAIGPSSRVKAPAGSRAQRLWPETGGSPGPFGTTGIR